MLPAEMRKFFFAELLKHLKVVWPILSVMIGAMVASGLVVCKLEQWPLRDGIYFAFISGLTIGYGDLAPLHPVSRALAIMTGFVGILMMGLVTAVGVRALDSTWNQQEKSATEWLRWIETDDSPFHRATIPPYSTAITQINLGLPSPDGLLYWLLHYFDSPSAKLLRIKAVWRPGDDLNERPAL